MRDEVTVPAADCSKLMEPRFDFAKIRRLFTTKPFRLYFDAMNAITGLYAETILEKQLTPGLVVRPNGSTWRPARTVRLDRRRSRRSPLAI